MKEKDLRGRGRTILSSILMLAATLPAMFLGGCGQMETLIVATDPSLPPFFRGFDIELAKKIAENTKRELEIRDIPSDRLLTELREKRVHMAISRIPIRKVEGGIVFSQPYYEASTAVLSLQGNNSVRKREDLQGATIAVAESSSAVEDPQQLNSQILTFPSRLETIEALREKKAVCSMMEEESAQLFARRDSDFHILPFTFPLEFYGIAVQEGDEKLLNSINETLAKLKATGEYDALLRAHFR